MRHRDLSIFTAQLIAVWASALSASAVALPPGNPPLSRGEIVITETFNDLFRIDPGTGQKAALDPGSFDPRDMIQIDGGLGVVAVDFMDRLVRFDPESLAVTPLTATLFPGAVDLAVEPSGDILVADQDRIFRVDHATGVTQPLVDDPNINGGFFSISSLAVGPTGRIFITEFFREIWEINPATGAATTPFFPNAGSILDLIDIRSDGDIIVQDFPSGNLLRINYDTRVVTTFATGLPTFTQDLAIEADDDVVVSSLEGIFRYDSTTGAESLLTPDETFFSPRAIAVAPVPEPSTMALALVAAVICTRGRVSPKTRGRVTVIQRRG